MADENRRFKETEVAQLIRRATELDALRQNSLTVEEIRSIAEELGTSRWAIDQAVGEFGSRSEMCAGDSPTKSIVGLEKLPARAAVIGAGATVAMLALSLFIGQDAGALGLLITALASLILPTAVRGKGRHKLFQISNGMLWGAFALTASLVWPSDVNGIVKLVSVLLAGSAVLGACVTEVRHRLANSGGPTVGGGKDERTIRLSRIGRRIKRLWEVTTMQFVANSSRVGRRQAFS